MSEYFDIPHYKLYMLPFCRKNFQIEGLLTSGMGNGHGQVVFPKKFSKPLLARAFHFC